MNRAHEQEATVNYEEQNRRYWNEVTPAHRDSEFYGVDPFLAGKTALYAREIEDLRNLHGKRLLHLQCHFGLDTLSWAREGAEVTGVDLSDVSIETAREIAEKAKIQARFLCNNVYDLPGPLTGETFDVVYTGRGASCWLRDLDRWAEIIAELLAPGGVLYLHDTHPMLYLWQEEGALPPFRVEGSYYHDPEPLTDEPGKSADYAGGDYIPKGQAYEWRWTIADILNSLIRA
ncbi:MAG: methyltransferase domain-containing protein, partial [bacterium]